MFKVFKCSNLVCTCAAAGVRARWGRARGEHLAYYARDPGREAAEFGHAGAQLDAGVLLAHVQGAERKHAAARQYSRQGEPRKSLLLTSRQLRISLIYNTYVFKFMELFATNVFAVCVNRNFQL